MVLGGVALIKSTTVPGGNLVDKTYYTIRNLVTDEECVVDVTHIRPFYFDLNYVTPLNVLITDTYETVVDTDADTRFLGFHGQEVVGSLVT